MMYKLGFLASVLMFRLMLDISYILVVSDIFSYHSYKFSFGIFQYLLSWLMLFLSFSIVSTKLIKVSDFFFLMTYLGLIVPMSSIYGLDDNRDIFPLLLTISSLYLINIITKLKSAYEISYPTVRDGEKLAIYISLVFVFFLIGWYLISGVTFNLDIAKVYEFREDNTEASTGGVFSYTNGWTYQIFNIFLISITLLHRKYLFCLLFVLIQIYFFSASAHKTVLFLPILVFGVWYYLKNTNKLIIIPFSFFLLILLANITYVISEDIMFSSLFSRRVFFVPARLTFNYFDFFSENPYVYWSNSVLSWLIDYPYTENVSKTIGAYLGNESNANNGFISSGYAHAGVFGVIVYSVFIGSILRFIDKYSSKNIPVWLGVSLTLVPLRNLILSSDFFTVLLTHGLLIALILIFLSGNKNIDN